MNRDGIAIPIIGMARAGWNLEKLRNRARASLEKAGKFDAGSSAELSAQLRYVGGDYTDPQTFQKLRKELGSAQRPIHYLAIQPSMFASVVKGLADSGSAKNARVIVEKPFGRDLASAQAPGRDPAPRSSPEDSDFPHRSLSRQGGGSEPALFPFR